MSIELDRIYNMDCLEGMKAIPDGTIDAVICDLPYGTTACKWDSVIPFDKLWEQYRRIIKEDGAICLFSQQPFTSALVMSNPDWFRYEWIWEKNRTTGFLNAANAPMKAHENVCIFYKKQPTYNPQFLQGDPYKVRRGPIKSHNYEVDQKCTETINDGKRYPIDIIQFNSEMDGFHPTQKPVDLLRYLVLTYTNEGDTVLDNCMGSGTTAIACIKERRHFIGFELNKEYFDKACKRIDTEQRQLTLF